MGCVQSAPESVNITSQDSLDASIVQSSSPRMPINGNIAAYLKNVPLLSKLTDDERTLLSKHLIEMQFLDKQNIITQGEAGNGFYIIKRGEVTVTRTNENGQQARIAALKEGDFFGEAALLNNIPRAASVTAKGMVNVYYLDRENFKKLFGQSKLTVQFGKRGAVSAEQQKETANTVPVSPRGSVHTGSVFSSQKKKTPENVSLINNAVRDNILFSTLDYEHRQKIIEEMYKHEVRANESVIKQGELGDHFYVVEKGEFAVFVNGQKVATRGRGQCFGELALMYNSPRAATVTAVRDSTVWVIDRATFRNVQTKLGEKKFDLYLSFLNKVELLNALSATERQKLAAALEEVSYPAGQTIFRQGEEGDVMFIVYSGEVKITKTENKSTAEVMRCKQGQYFGERALLKKEPRAATASAIGDVTLLKIDRQGFNILLGSLEDMMNQNTKKYDAVKVAPPAPKPEPAGYKPKFEDLKSLGTLGKGSFGHVKLVQDKNTGQTFALKGVSKAQIVATGQQSHIMNEKRALIQLNHPFIIRLYNTYKDKDRLYFLQELCLGGELFTVLRERTLFDEDTARFYAASVILAFEFMHDVNIIYRDLKPENLLLAQDGYLKVTDFGFAKDISGGRTWTLCGTPDYLSPEIVAGKGHGKGVDWWTVGVFIFEMLASYPPFYDEDPMRTYAKIMQGNVVYPSHFSREAENLIKRLLQLNPARRLGCGKDGAKEIKAHPWFRNFDWDALVNKKIKPPIMPKVKSNTDMSNFDRFGDDDRVEPYRDDGSNWDADF